MLRSISKQSGESIWSVLKKKRKATVGRICRKGRFWAWNERVKGWWMMRVVSRWNRWRKCHSKNWAIPNWIVIIVIKYHPSTECNKTHRPILQTTANLFSHRISKNILLAIGLDKQQNAQYVRNVLSSLSSSTLFYLLVQCNYQLDTSTTNAQEQQRWLCGLGLPCRSPVSDRTVRFFCCKVRLTISLTPDRRKSGIFSGVHFNVI